MVFAMEADIAAGEHNKGAPIIVNVKPSVQNILF